MWQQQQQKKLFNYKVAAELTWITSETEQKVILIMTEE